MSQDLLGITDRDLEARQLTYDSDPELSALETAYFAAKKRWENEQEPGLDDTEYAQITRYGPCLVECALTYDTCMSKNKRLGRGKKNQTYVLGESKRAESLVRQEIGAAAQGTKFYRNKIYLDLTIHKPRGNIDAINFLDAVADCVKKAIEVDDCWFAIKSIDWHVDALNPRMYLRLFQPDRTDIKICSLCGKGYPPIQEFFNLSKMHKDGLNSRCIWCIRIMNKQRKRLEKKGTDGDKSKS